LKALSEGKRVYWSNEGYVVIENHGLLYASFIANGYMCGLQDNELSQCFIGGA
jgi:hypothetical protein